MRWGSRKYAKYHSIVSRGVIFSVICFSVAVGTSNNIAVSDSIRSASSDESRMAQITTGIDGTASPNGSSITLTRGFYDARSELLGGSKTVRPCDSNVQSCIDEWSRPPIASASQSGTYNEIKYRSILGVCSSLEDNWCIESVTVTLDGTNYTATPGEPTNALTTECIRFPNTPVGFGLIVPSDGCPRKWSIRETATLNTFVVKVGVEGSGSFTTSWQQGQGLLRPSQRDRNIVPTSLDAEIIPFGKGPSSLCAQTLLRQPVENVRPTVISRQANGVLTYAMPTQSNLDACTFNWTDATYQVKIRHSIDLRDWAFGRISNAQFSVATTPLGFTTTVSGAPVRTQYVSASYTCQHLIDAATLYPPTIGNTTSGAPKSALATGVQMKHPTTGAWGPWTPMCRYPDYLIPDQTPSPSFFAYTTQCRWREPATETSGRGLSGGTCATLPLGGFDPINGFGYSGYLFDLIERTSGEVTYWSAQAQFSNPIPVRGVEGVDYWYEDPCSGNRFLGFTSSNAALYESRPTFDPITGSLTISMVSPHRSSNGEQSKGEVSISISKAYALCKWGLDPNTTSASLSLQYPRESVLQPIAFSLTSDDNFFHLRARDFHFSAPKARLSFGDAKKTRSLRVSAKGRKQLTVRQLVRIPRGLSASWRVTRGNCVITGTFDNDTQRARKAPTVSAPRRGKSCKVAVTLSSRTKSYGQPAKTSRTTVTLTS